MEAFTSTSEVAPEASKQASITWHQSWNLACVACAKTSFGGDSAQGYGVRSLHLDCLLCGRHIGERVRLVAMCHVGVYESGCEVGVLGGLRGGMERALSPSTISFFPMLALALAFIAANSDSSCRTHGDRVGQGAVS